MGTEQPYFTELSGVQVSNQLYQRWIEYALTFSREEALTIARYGLTHQARALRSMVREALSSNTDVSGTVHIKLETLVQAALRSESKLREINKLEKGKRKEKEKEKDETPEREWRADLL